MTITTKTPFIKQTVGALYACFATAHSPAMVYDIAVVKSEVVKAIKTTENADSAVLRASGKVYKTITAASSIEHAVEVVAFDPADLAKMRGDTVDVGGLVLSGAPADRPYFAFGKVVQLDGGKFRYEWFPKCQLTANSDDIATSEEKFSEQNDTLTITAYPFDTAGNIKASVQSDMTGFPAGLTEAEFFAAPILTAANLITANGV